MRTINPKELSTRAISNFLTSAVVPRPIALVSTIDESGTPNLSPFSFFNAFSNVPPILVFSPAKSSLTGNIKDTYQNVKTIPECVIHIANYAMAEQLSVTSGLYPSGVNEFLKGGFTEEKSLLVRPPRVKEAPIAFECVVKQIIELGNEGGAGNLVICEIVMIHHQEELADENGNIIIEKLDPIARLGYNYYSRIFAEDIFETPKPLNAFGVGVDAIPQWIKDAGLLTGNELGKLASLSTVPEKTEIENEPALEEIVKNFKSGSIHLIKELLDENKMREAWLVLLNIH
ncbi:flavin reductase family protein [Ferruginibacter lapsinanis]|uniref:flavin reductase family protein n=1 Tax=Ferruginibacter lapsinanis TaxID=563172 RepID=UPI001E497EC0|nr:flavin reductase family protein [Ferruginibacter lapsinanis]UEG50764.1 flavin reductase family protein [Ferruginibacter lapsinanis]